MNTAPNSISASMRFILVFSGGLMLAAMLGSYGYTSSVKNEMVEEQRVWRDEHNQAVGGSLKDIKIEQKELRREINRKFERLEDQQGKAYDKIGEKLEKILEQKGRTP